MMADHNEQLSGQNLISLKCELIMCFFVFISADL